MVLHNIILVLLCVVLFTPVIEENSRENWELKSSTYTNINGCHLWSNIVSGEIGLVDWYYTEGECVKDMWPTNGIPMVQSEMLGKLWKRFTKSFLGDNNDALADPQYNWYGYFCSNNDISTPQAWTDIFSDFVWRKQAVKQEILWYTPCGILDNWYSMMHPPTSTQTSNIYDIVSASLSIGFDRISQALDIHAWSNCTVFDRVSQALDINAWNNWMRGFVVLMLTIVVIELYTGRLHSEARIFWFRMYTAPKLRQFDLKKCTEEEVEARKNFFEMYCKPTKEVQPSEEELYHVQSEQKIADLEDMVDFERNKNAQLKKELELAQKYILMSGHELLLYKAAFLESQNKKPNLVQNYVFNY